MRACVQRVRSAQVSVEEQVTGQIQLGLLVLLGVAQDDTRVDAQYLAEKISALRVFEDDAGKMNRSLSEAGGAMLVVSQFTLLGDCRRGRRPSFTTAAEPEVARELYQDFVRVVRQAGIEVQCGRFREQMQVELINDGPVTLLLDSRKAF